MMDQATIPRTMTANRPQAIFPSRLKYEPNPLIIAEGAVGEAVDVVVLVTAGAISVTAVAVVVMVTVTVIEVVTVGVVSSQMGPTAAAFAMLLIVLALLKSFTTYVQRLGRHNMRASREFMTTGDVS
ncbi:hypothetical protein BGX38DRAFT_1152225 [Terfezia claveryi]|nr:hypothetical protein BGX38DRAFT_1152225 [Terfezia claveryi]